MGNPILIRRARATILLLLLGAALFIASCVALAPADGGTPVGSPAVLNLTSAPVPAFQHAEPAGERHAAAAITSVSAVTVPTLIRGDAQVSLPVTTTRSATPGLLLVPTPTAVAATPATTTVTPTATALAATAVLTEPTAATGTTTLSTTLSPTLAALLVYARTVSTTAALTTTGDVSTTSSLSPTPFVRETLPLTQAQVVRITADRLNVRSEPSTDGEIVAKLLLDTRAEVTEVSSDEAWYAVLLDDGATGWIAADYAAVEGAMEDAAADRAAASQPATSTTEAAAGTLEATDVSTEEAATKEAATKEAATEEAATEEAAAQESATQEAAAASTVEAPTAITQAERINVRGGPGTDYPVVTNTPAATALPILATTAAGDWYQVQLPELEEPGWVYGPLVELQGSVESVTVLAEEELPPLPEAPTEVPAAAPAAAAAAAPAPPPAGGGFFGYGVQAHMLGGGIDEATSATAAMGFNWIKQQVEWRVFEGSQGSVDLSELRRIVDSAGGRGISVLFSVVNAPDWAREPGFDANVGGPPADPATYAAFVGRLAGEFCGSALKAIEVWNEQNLHYEWGNKPLDPAEYMNLLRAAYGSIKAACPSMLVISGAPTPAGDAGPYARDDFAYLEGMYQNGLANYADGIGAHPSGYNVPPRVGWQEACAAIQQTGNFFNGPCDTPHHSWSFRSTMEGYRNIMVVYGDTGKRIWPTEFGWAAGGMLDGRYAYADDNSFEEQANWTVEAFQMMREWGWVGPAFLWNLNFRVVADGTEKAQWGIVRNDYTPLPVYSALQAMPK